MVLTTSLVCSLQFTDAYATFKHNIRLSQNVKNARNAQWNVKNVKNVPTKWCYFPGSWIREDRWFHYHWYKCPLSPSLDACQRWKHKWEYWSGVHPNMLGMQATMLRMQQECGKGSKNVEKAARLWKMQQICEAYRECVRKKTYCRNARNTKQINKYVMYVK